MYFPINSFKTVNPVTIKRAATKIVHLLAPQISAAFAFEGNIKVMAHVVLYGPEGRSLILTNYISIDMCVERFFWLANLISYCFQ